MCCFAYNGRTEGINNKIKVLNRGAYGYRNFKHYNNRILLHFAYKLVEPQKKKHKIKYMFQLHKKSRNM
uniref:transposase n=1 Tax=Halolactibacillus halophilus TaxID=306540 RepID=UPI00190ED02E|nr:transposase [Halolactibacillus halophilus]